MTTITIPKALLEQALEKLLECWPKSDPCINGIRAERAKPVEQAEPVAWMWQHEETGRTGFIETSLAKDWAKLNPRQPLVMPVYKHPPTPAWHDAPEVAALKAERDLARAQLEAEHRINSETLSVLERTEQKLNVLLDRATVAKAERDAAMKDAERYRWLTRTSDTNKFMVCDTDNQILYFGWEADEAIDAAIAKAEGDAIKKGG